MWILRKPIEELKKRVSDIEAKEKEFKYEKSEVDNEMWVSRNRIKDLEQKTAGLEKMIQNQQYYLEVVYEFCKSVANKDKQSLISYQQLHSPSPDSAKKIRMLLQKVRELG